MAWLKLGLFPVTLLLAACQPKAEHLAETGGPASQAKSPASPFNNPVALPEPSERAVDLILPEPGEVLRAIYKKAGDGSSAYSIGDRAWANYWYGHTYEIGGRRYFTGFACNTAERLDETEEGYAAPGDQVEITQATYVKAPEGSVAAWEFVGAERGIGSFGGYERANAIDDRSQAQTYSTPHGKYFLAVPTWYLDGGVRVSTSEIFCLDPSQHRWRYMGSIQTGEDNSAGCSDDPEERLAPCAISMGSVIFRPQFEEEAPSIQVAKKGAVVEAPGKIRELGLAEAEEYLYDKAESRYQLAR